MSFDYGFEILERCCMQNYLLQTNIHFFYLLSHCLDIEFKSLGMQAYIN